MTSQFPTCTIGWRVKPDPETGTLDEDQFAEGKIMK